MATGYLEIAVKNERYKNCFIGNFRGLLKYQIMHQNLASQQCREYNGCPWS